jgi:GNAT superfamily N-acetyltransferase
VAEDRKPDAGILLIAEQFCPNPHKGAHQSSLTRKAAYMTTSDDKLRASITLSEGFTDNDRGEIARMYWASFGVKLRVALSPQDKAIAMLAEALNPTSAIVARAGNWQLLGLAGYKTAKGSFLAITFEVLKRHFGVVGAIWRGAVLCLLERRTDSSTLLMDGIFVAESARGQGVGTLLLGAIKRKAVEKGCSHVRLDVIDTNPRAQQLYEREGFKAVAIRNLGPLRHLFGFQRTTTMMAESSPTQ